MKDLIQSIESRFQVLFTLSIFFSSLIYYLGKASDQGESHIGVAMLQLGGLVGVILIDYIIFQSTKQDFSEKSLQYINKALLGSFYFFATPILFLAILASITSKVPLWIINGANITLETLIVFILAIPIVIEFMLIIFFIVSDRKHRKNKK